MKTRVMAAVALVAAGCAMADMGEANRAPSGAPPREATDDGSTGGDTSGSYDGDGKTAGPGVPEGMGDSGGVGGGSGSGSGNAQPGTLTAGAWDDNRNFDFYLSYLENLDPQTFAGLPVVPRADRLVVRVVDAAGHPLPGATVTFFRTAAGAADAVAFRATTGAEGTVLAFPQHDGCAAGEQVKVVAEAAGARAETTLVAGTAATASLVLPVAAAATGALDVALVIDATGSMGDEMQYLKVEIDAIAASVAQAHPGLAQRWALVIYRDHGDEFVVRTHAFTSDVEEFRRTLSQYGANGGGDYPEVPETGLAEAAKLVWTPGAAARLAFLVADAPHHAGAEAKLVEAVDALRDASVHVYPVASSGVDELTEASMRMAAQMTGGRYLFLTDDSGVGGEHKEPRIPCYFVTKLDSAIRRMIAIELSGIRTEPAREDVIRTGGNPEDGACKLSDGRQVQVF